MPLRSADTTKMPLSLRTIEFHEDNMQSPSKAPSYCELDSPDGLLDPNAVASDLKAIDWAFTTDDTSYLSHDIHPYPAKFIPQIPGHLIARLSLRGELVFDPFAGSGTTALEAVRLGRRALGVDANRVGVLAGRVKTSRLHREDVRDIHAIRSVLLASIEQLPADPSALLASHAEFIPDIPNRHKWFPDTSCGELAFIRASITRLESAVARDVANLALSRIVLKVSFQDSETRYASRPREIPGGETIWSFLRAIDDVVKNLQDTASDIRYGVADFIEADARRLDTERFPDESVDLIVSSPPYGNANDYHLYHRFRLFWLGADPRILGKMEIGSHLRHQKESSGCESYQDELGLCLQHFARVLRPGRYAAFVVGDSIYAGECYRGSDIITRIAQRHGLRNVVTIDRPIHRTKRSFVAAGRRATAESIVVLQKPLEECQISLAPPPYRLWDYERRLRCREVEMLTGCKPKGRGVKLALDVAPPSLPLLRSVAFSHSISLNGGNPEPTWQAIVENGLAGAVNARKDPKYVTHGIHPYKGKFYPQLAKALINIARVPAGSRVLDPFCGSGTTLLESNLNGLAAVGCDLHPLAARIARAKVGILELDPALVTEAAETLREKVQAAPSRFPNEMDQFEPEAREEIDAWFPRPVVLKLNWLLRAIRSVSAATLRDFLEVILSSIVRDVSNQEPSDLRIRRRKKPITDADVLKLFDDALQMQMHRLERFWEVRGHCPFRFCKAQAAEGDSRDWTTFERLGLAEQSVDLVLTSPPYATALPYIDTDRLSLAVLYGLTSASRRPLEHGLTGSREITRAVRDELETRITDRTTGELPTSVVRFVRKLHKKVVEGDVGFRRRNMPALLMRFFGDMNQVLSNVARAMKPAGNAMIVMGDNAMSVESETICIPTTDFVRDIACSVGFEFVESIPITVTTENRVHIRNAIKKNVVLWLRRR